MEALSFLKPNPDTDEIKAIFYCLQTSQIENDQFIQNGMREGYSVGVIIVGEDYDYDLNTRYEKLYGYKFSIVVSEEELINHLISIVDAADPDILTGYETENSSWGFVSVRCTRKYGHTIFIHLSYVDRNLMNEISRILTEKKENQSEMDFFNTWGYQKTTSWTTCGRLFLNCWRIMRAELSLTSYTLENIVFHVLHKRFDSYLLQIIQSIPKFAHDKLSVWYKSVNIDMKWRTFNYYFDRVQYTLQILDDTNFISRTCEYARVFGIDFSSVSGRGSQYKVESMMARIAKPENFIMISPSHEDVTIKTFFLLLLGSKYESC